MKGLRRKLLASITTLVVAIVSVAGSAYAWFTLSTTVDAKMEFEVVAGDGLEIAYSLNGTNFSDYSSTVNIDFTEAGDGFALGAVTSTNGTNFNGIKVEGQTYSMDNDVGANTEGRWFEVQFKFRTQTEGAIKLDTNTAVVNTSHVGASVKAQDAVRLSFTNNATTPATNIWEPNKGKGSYGGTYASNEGWKYFVDHAVGDSAGAYNPLNGAILNEDGNDTTYFIYTTPRVVALNTHLTSNPNQTTVEDIVDLNANLGALAWSPEGEYSVATLTVRLWIEGFDADAYDVIYKQKFSVSLVFTKTTTNP